MKPTISSSKFYSLKFCTHINALSIKIHKSYLDFFIIKLSYGVNFSPKLRYSWLSNINLVVAIHDQSVKVNYFSNTNLNIDWLISGILATYIYVVT